MLRALLCRFARRWGLLSNRKVTRLSCRKSEDLQGLKYSATKMSESAEKLCGTPIAQPGAFNLRFALRRR